MSSVNKVILIGNLGRDPEVRYTPSGSAVCNVTIATTRSWKSKESGEKVEETEWHRIVFYDKLAEIAGEYLTKGRSVYIEGRLKTRKWTDKDGVEKYTTEVIADQMNMLGSRPEGGGQEQEPQQRQQPQQRGSQGGAAGGQQSQAPRTQQRQAPAPRTGGSTGFDNMDDDIPF